MPDRGRDDSTTMRWVIVSGVSIEIGVLGRDARSRGLFFEGQRRHFHVVRVESNSHEVGLVDTGPESNSPGHAGCQMVERAGSGHDSRLVRLTRSELAELLADE